QARSPVVTKPPLPSKPGTSTLTRTAALGISRGPVDSNAPEAFSVFVSPPAVKDSLPLKLALSSPSGVNAARRTWSGPLGVGAGAGAACSAGCLATDADLSPPLLRALETAKTVAPRSATPRRARRKGREIAIAWH